TAWFDGKTGTTEEVAFIPSGTGQLFGVMHLPAGTPAAAVVIASPLHEEMVKNYRPEVLLARALAARGIAAQRFHYRGFGHSDGDPADTTFDSMLDDLAAAASHLSARTGLERVMYVGTRLGGLVASFANTNRDPIVLWEPVANSERYFRDIGRFGLMRAAA